MCGRMVLYVAGAVWAVVKNRQLEREQGVRGEGVELAVVRGARG